MTTAAWPYLGLDAALAKMDSSWSRHNLPSARAYVRRSRALVRDPDAAPAVELVGAALGQFWSKRSTGFVHSFARKILDFFKTPEGLEESVALVLDAGVVYRDARGWLVRLRGEHSFFDAPLCYVNELASTEKSLNAVVARAVPAGLHLAYTRPWTRARDEVVIPRQDLEVLALLYEGTPPVRPRTP